MYSQASVFLPFWAPQGYHVIVGLGLHAYRIRILRWLDFTSIEKRRILYDVPSPSVSDVHYYLYIWLMCGSASIAFSLSITRTSAESFSVFYSNGKVHRPNLLWPPCVADADIIFSSCGFFFFLLFLFFSSPNLSGHTLDVYHTSTHGVALVRI